MKFVKENLTLVICAAIALLFVAALFWPLGSMVSSFQDSMKQRLASKDLATKYANTPLTIPGADPKKGVPPQKLIDFKAALIKSINDGALQVEKAAADLNAQGRISKDGFPLMNGEELKGFVPKLTGQPLEFKARYGAQFPVWTTMLVGKANAQATPPDSNALKTDYDALMAAQQANLPPGMALNSGLNGAQDPKQFLDYEKRKINARASEIQMYLDASPTGGAFQVRPWFQGDEPPNEQQIYEALVDSWLQGEVVRAISQVNKAVLDKLPAGDRNVGKAPIKRLFHLMIGNNAAAQRLNGASSPGMGYPGATGSVEEPGPQYFTGAAAGAGIPAPAAAAAPGAGTMPPPNYDAGLTGRVSGPLFDVVLISVHMDIDPAYLQKFMDQLYRQNVGYTVLTTQIKTVDPLDRVSYGYVYGETQTVEAEFLVEALLLRGWTAPLMPASVKAQSGVAAPAGAPAAAPAQPPALRGN